jgi:hypothetical protein
MKNNTVYSVVEECAVPGEGNVLRDAIVSLPSLEKKGEKPVRLRRLKGFRRIFSRFAELDVLFRGFLTFALTAEAPQIVLTSPKAFLLQI